MNFRRFFGFQKPVSASDAAESEEKLDVTIQKTQDITTDVVKKAQEEIAHSERIIRVAEQAVRLLKKVERQHQH
jgi:hypothetical protein